MRSYAMRGTPSWLLYDTDGQLRQHWFGDIDALRLGAEIRHAEIGHAEIKHAEIGQEEIKHAEIKHLVDDRSQTRGITNAVAKPGAGTCDDVACTLPDA